MPYYSVKDQYCDLKSGTWHQTVYVGSEMCHVEWYEKLFSPQHMKFTTGKCTEGFELDFCVKGPCQNTNWDDTTSLTSNTVPNALEHPVAVW